MRADARARDARSRPVNTPTSSRRVLVSRSRGLPDLPLTPRRDKMLIRPALAIVLALLYLGAGCSTGMKADPTDKFDQDKVGAKDRDLEEPRDQGQDTGASDRDDAHNAPNQQARKAGTDTRKVHRSVGWAIGTAMCLATILVLVATVAVTSKGAQTTTQGEEPPRGCCCNILLWLTKTSSQLPLWKALLLKLFVTVLSTIAAGLFSLLLTNLLAEKEESIEATVRDILGIEDEPDTVRRKRETAPDDVHWLAVLFLVWLTTVPLVCYIVLTKCTDTMDQWTGSEPPTNSRIEDRGSRIEDRGSRSEGQGSNSRTKDRRARGGREARSSSSLSIPSLPTPPSPLSFTAPTPPPTCWVPMPTSANTAAAQHIPPAHHPHKGSLREGWLEQLQRGFKAKPKKEQGTDSSLQATEELRMELADNFAKETPNQLQQRDPRVHI